MGIGSSKAGAYEREDLQLLVRVADLVALAVENALTRAALKKEKDRFQALLDVGKTLISNRKPEELFREISVSIRNVVGHDYASLSLYDQGTNSFRIHMLDLPYAKGFVGFHPLGPNLVVPLEDTIAAGPTFLNRETRILTYAELMRGQSKHTAEFVQQGFRSLCCMPLVTGKGALGTLNLASMRDAAFLPQDVGLLNQLAGQIAAALDNAKAYHEVAELTEKLKKEKLYLQDEIRSELNFEEIIGESPALTRVLSQVKTVAPSNATTLILGETGTGKELIARAIHRLSSRKDGTFIKLNCAAIPTGLLESELFGHEKGAFTGAVTQKIGRLELADKGTLFLDEVGDIPSELQPKLLRVLQDQEFERLGGNRTIRVNIRLIAATNRNLAQAVAEREFRSDLYYRLNVFPIHMPALRERTKDIPLLVRYFVQKLSRRMNKQIETIPTETMNALIRWDWPGNVRELENFIERSVILTEGSVLNVPLAELRSGDLESEIDGTLENMEREFIIRVLRETSGVIAGSHGAAARLGLKRTTLQSRMLKMGISRRDYED
jgi:formate hydrogenlyase transcriptional activator